MEYMLASVTPARVWNVYPSREAAEADRVRANEYGAKRPPAFAYEPMTMDAYLDRERDYWLGRPEVEITEDEWMEALEVLPPLRWETTEAYGRFLMSEMTSGPYPRHGRPLCLAIRQRVRPIDMDGVRPC